MDSSYEYFDSDVDGLKYSYDSQYDTLTVRGFGWCAMCMDRIVLSQSFRIADRAFSDDTQLREIVLKLPRKQEYKGRHTIYYEIAHDSCRGVYRTDVDMQDAELPPPDEFYFGCDAFMSSKFTSFAIPFFMKPERVLPSLRTAPCLSEVKVSERSPYMTAKKGIVYSKDMSQLLLIPASSWHCRFGLDVPSSVKELREEVFSEVSTLEKITVGPTTILPKTGLQTKKGALIVEIRKE